MMRVVDALPGKEEIAAYGMAEKNFWTDPDAYRYFVEQYRRDFLAFEHTFSGNTGTADEATDPGRTGRALAASDEACIEAFDRSRPLFYYHRGSLYRYRIDRTGPAERPIILESYERSEVTGSVLGIPVYAQRQGLLMRACLWIEKRLQERERREKG
jgi:hypothetical protein